MPVQWPRVARGTGIAGFNVQTAVDAQHNMIVAHDVTNVGNDRDQLTKLAKQARSALCREDLEVLADRGYYKGEEILACQAAGMTPLVPKGQRPGAASRKGASVSRTSSTPATAAALARRPARESG